jgi:glucose-1-phosphate thymidylyltransferase
MKALILAAGFATRLYPITKEKAKALLDVKGKAILEHILEKVFEIESIDEAIVISNEKFHKDFSTWAEKKDFNLRVISNGVEGEAQSGGAVKDLIFVLKKEKIDDGILLLAGDSLFDFSLLPPNEIFKKKGDSVIVLKDMLDVEKAKNLGVAQVEKDKVVNFEEKPEYPRSTLCSTAIYFINKESVNFLLSSKEGEFSTRDNLGIILDFLQKKTTLRAFIAKGSYTDIGTPKTYNAVR